VSVTVPAPDEAVTGKLALIEPPGITNDAGTVTDCCPSCEMATVVAAASVRDRVAVQVVLPPGATRLEALHPTEERVNGAGFNKTAAVEVCPPADAVICAEVSALTAVAAAVKLTCVAPAGAVTEVGTVR
jgi:hypothetical protein